MSFFWQKSARRIFPGSAFGWIGLGTLLVGCFLSRLSLQADPIPNAVMDRMVTGVVTKELSREHLTQHPLDDEISKRWMKMYFKSLDPWKLYFLQSDLDEFARYETQLDDMAQNKDIQVAYAIFKRYLQRVDERVATVDELLKDPIDFTANEEYNVDVENLKYAKTVEEIKNTWRMRLKYDFLLLKSGKDKLEGADAVAKIKRRYNSFANRMHQTDENELLETYLTALTTSYDPHTTYMSPDSYTNFMIQMRLKLSGIGASLRFDDGYTIVQEIISGGAADKDHRLKPKDRVIGVGQGTSGEIDDVMDMKLNDVVKRIRGNPGTVVRLQVLPDGKNEPQVYAITRAEIELKDSEARSVIFDQGKKPDGTPYKIGFIDLPSFYMDMDAVNHGDPDFKSTTRDVERLLNEFKTQKVDGVVLDLRKNGGGSLTEAINMVGLFIDSGPVVQVKDIHGEVNVYDDNHRGMAWNGPLVVLVSKFSASASEIFAGAIQDYQRGLILGDKKTHGKGTVQSLLNLSSKMFGEAPNAPVLGALKITMQQFYRADGDSTQNRGVVSDLELPSLSSHYDMDESTLPYALKFDAVPAKTHAKMGFVSPAVVQKLAELSASRRAQSNEFAKLDKRITRYEEQQKKKRIDLNEEHFLGERAEINAQEEEEKDLEELGSTHKEVVKKDFYIDEVLAITADYLAAFRGPLSSLGSVQK
jgi:carboxyl-terminal processing protease